MSRRNDVPAEVAELFRYDPATGLLHWAKSSDPRIKVGAVACALNVQRYRYVYVNRKKYLAHRVVWFLMTGKQPPETIDHRDCDTGNNRWSNLREATNSQSGANRRQQDPGRLKGTQLFRGKWRATIRVNKRLIFLGTFDTEAAAHAAYVAAAIKHFGAFARAA